MLCFAVVSPQVTKKEFIKLIVNLLLMVPVLINLLLVAGCDIGLWYVLDSVQDMFTLEVDVEGKA